MLSSPLYLIVKYTCYSKMKTSMTGWEEEPCGKFKKCGTTGFL